MEGKVRPVSESVSTGGGQLEKRSVQIHAVNLPDNVDDRSVARDAQMTVSGGQRFVQIGGDEQLRPHSLAVAAASDQLWVADRVVEPEYDRLDRRIEFDARKVAQIVRQRVGSDAGVVDVQQLELLRDAGGSKNVDL